ncbi:MAG: hypothetical protein HN952_05685 [Candidatus Cloacimonetes bacterium]|jgi:hypothetical protein|nr:hypothetical protein [Candidatus Cloacimonadota bacterium]MBT6994430.1 hypothetical protein [Candidatus Cloacimonadota bacterium]MBT7469843.1 hypothetical protein [Candidatus Cloacimonadota bacterium]
MKHFLISLFLIILFSCETSSPQDVLEMEIMDIYDTIKESFLVGDLERIMQFYHTDFQHDNDDYDGELTVWQLRRINHETIDFSDIEFGVYDNFVEVSFTLHLDDESFVEPETFGDISFFYFTSQNEWKICGNYFDYLN